jgi:hypothetical protein
MIESMLFLIAGIAALALFAVILLGVTILKALTRLLLLPFSFAAGLLKVLILGLVALLMLVLLPFGLLVAVFAIPALLIVGIVTATRSLIAA